MEASCTMHQGHVRSLSRGGRRGISRHGMARVLHAARGRGRGLAARGHPLPAPRLARWPAVPCLARLRACVSSAPSKHAGVPCRRRGRLRAGGWWCRALNRQHVPPLPPPRRWQRVVPDHGAPQHGELLQALRTMMPRVHGVIITGSHGRAAPSLAPQHAAAAMSGQRLGGAAAARAPARAPRRHRRSQNLLTEAIARPLARRRRQGPSWTNTGAGRLQYWPDRGGPRTPAAPLRTPAFNTPPPLTARRLSQPVGHTQPQTGTMQLARAPLAQRAALGQRARPAPRGLGLRARVAAPIDPVTAANMSQGVRTDERGFVLKAVSPPGRVWAGWTARGIRAPRGAAPRAEARVTP
jgi:hypothetical protein